MVFERLGCSLYDYLTNHDYKPFPLRCIRAYAWQLLTALEYCHRIKLIHTDLKPENILLVDDEEEPWGGASPSSSASSSSYDSPYASDRDQWSNHRQWKKRDLASSSQASGVHSDSDSQRAVLRPPASNAVKCTCMAERLDACVRSLIVAVALSCLVIDFGGATYDHESKSSIINTRQYRSPEVILGLGWSYPSDIWSAGCIIAELYLGELLFATVSGPS
jgi:serine/threonine protein kinase